MFQMPGSKSKPPARSGIAAASQADQEAASSTLVYTSPGTQKYHPSAAKAWACVTMSAGAPTLAANFNVTSITDSGVGQFVVNFTVSFSSTAYAVAVGAKSTVGDARAIASQGTAEARAVGSCGIATGNSTTAAYTDYDSWYAVFFGDQ